MRQRRPDPSEGFCESAQRALTDLTLGSPVDKKLPPVCHSAVCLAQCHCDRPYRNAEDTRLGPAKLELSDCRPLRRRIARQMGQAYALRQLPACERCLGSVRNTSCTAGTRFEDLPLSEIAVRFLAHHELAG